MSTNYVTIDGSNTSGGSSKDLIIIGATTSNTKPVIRIFGDNDYINIKNSIIINKSSSGSNQASIQLTNRDASNLKPDDCTIQNNTLISEDGNGSAGIHVSQSGSPTVGISNLTIRDNIISARVRGIFISYTANCDIFNNTIEVNSQASQGASGMSFQTNFSAAGTFNVYNNKIIRLRSLNTSAGANNGIIGIDNQNVSPKIVNIFNNFITGFESATTTTNSKFYAIRTSSSTTVSIYHNTIVIPEMTDFSDFGTSYIGGIAYANTSESSPTAGGSLDIKNNIVIVNETSMKVWGIRRVGTNGTFTSNYNNLYVNSSATNGYVGYFNSTDNLDFDAWKVTSSQDANSKSKSVNFVSTTDLHLTGSSNGDVDLIGTPLSSPYNVDIDGDSRSATYPYMGADEASTPLPIELNYFTYNISGNSVNLFWQTINEINSYGFEIERAFFAESRHSSTITMEWQKIGFVTGHGNSNSPKNYSFTDKNLNYGKYHYRLKMIDNDGSFKYGNVVEVEISIPKEFILYQNYPNPFNPETTIKYSIPTGANVRLDIYSITGELVKTLVDEMQNSGNYTVTFNADKLPSGTYIYRLTANDFVQTKKMILIK